MRLLIVSAVFPPEPVVSAQTSAQVAGAAAERGHQVLVVASFPSKPAGRLYAGYGRRLFRRERAPAGYDLIRCFSILAPASRLGTRFLENLSFGITSSWVALTSPRADVIYANSWPIVATGLLAAVARLRKIPLVITVQDVYPESIVAQRRAAGENLPVRTMRRVDAAIARSCRALIVIGERFARIYREDRGVEAARIHVVPNWVDDVTLVVDDPHAASLRKRLGIAPEAVVVVYGGNIGPAAGLQTVIESFRDLADMPQLHLLVAGEGSNLAACRLLARQTGNPRLTFYTPWPAQETSMVFAAADILVLPTRGSQSLASMPSKLIGYMLAARAVLALALPESDVAGVIEQSGCGWIVEPDNPAALAVCLRRVVHASPAERRARGEAGRAFALHHYSSNVALPRVLTILEDAAQATV